MSLLEVDALHAGYDDALVLQGVSLRADAHEIVAVIGPNGAGKSTLLKAVYGLVTRTAGTVRWNGEDVTGTRADRLTLARLAQMEVRRPEQVVTASFTGEADRDPLEGLP